MKLYKEGIGNFEPWGGAVKTWEAIQNANKEDELEAILEDFCPDGMSETDLNDLLWFEPETVTDWLGMDYCHNCGFDYDECENCTDTINKDDILAIQPCDSNGAKCELC